MSRASETWDSQFAMVVWKIKAGFRLPACASQIRKTRFEVLARRNILEQTWMQKEEGTPAVVRCNGQIPGGTITSDHPHACILTSERNQEIGINAACLQPKESR